MELLIKIDIIIKSFFFVFVLIICFTILFMMTGTLTFGPMRRNFDSC